MSAVVETSAAPRRRTAVRSLAFAFAAAVVLVAVPALAGSYLDRAGLIVRQSRTESDYLRARLSDKDLAKLVHAQARARVGAARNMTVPKEVAQAHPHLLLMLENYEQAASAAVDGSAARFFVYQRRARDEEAVFRGVLKQLGWALPDGAAFSAVAPLAGLRGEVSGRAPRDDARARP